MRTSLSRRFDRAALPSSRFFYERELGELRRPSHGWAVPKGGCPFHQSKSKTSFRVNLDTGGFNCFGCGAKGGDVLAFLRQRYRLGFKAAAQQLGAWRDQPPVPGAITESERQRTELAERKHRERQRRIAA